MNTYLITTTWSAGRGTAFKREHVRYAKNKAGALAEERAHNRRNEPIMKLDQLPGDKPWKWKITGAHQLGYQPRTAAGKAKRAKRAHRRCFACGR